MPAYSPLEIEKRGGMELVDDDVYRRDSNAMRKSIYEQVDSEKRLPPSMWGVALVIVVVDLPALAEFQATITQTLRIVVCFFLVMLNLGLQIFLLIQVLVYIVEGNVEDLQLDYRQYHAEVFDTNGGFLEDVWDDWNGPKDALCKAAISRGAFTSVVLFLWMTRMLGEVREIYRMSRHIESLPRLPDELSFKDMVYTQQAATEQETDQYVLISMGTRTKVAIWVLIFIPRYLFGIMLAYIGLRWLNSTESFSELILNSLALEFIINIDELLYQNFLPEVMFAQVEATKIGVPKGVDDNSPEIHSVGTFSTRKNLSSWLRTVAFIVACLGIVFVYRVYGQQVLPGYMNDLKSHCSDWVSEKITPLCAPFESNCFPYGANVGDDT